MSNVPYVRSLMFALGVTLLAAAGLQGAQPLGFWRVETAPDGFCSAVSPAGERKFMRGVDHVSLYGSVGKKRGRRFHDMYIGKYGNRENWAAAQVARVREAGFNLISIGSPRHLGVPHAILLQMTEYMARSGRKDLYLSEFKGGPGQAFPNVFSPEFEGWCDRAAARSCAPHREDRDLFGYFIDNELAWKCLGTNDMAYIRKVAERYFSVTTAAIRRHDPNHLILGCRFAGLDGAPLAVWKAAGQFCDVITFNCYPWADIDRNVVLDAKGGVPLVSRLAKLYELTGKPLLITEWSFPALDTGRPCLNGAGQRFRTQTERVQASELFARTLLSQPYVLGYSYFMWIDQPALGTNGDNPEDSNYGLVSESGVPYAGLTDMFTRLHRKVSDGVRRPPMPKEKVAPPLKNRSTADIFRSRAKGNPKDIRFNRKCDVWELANAAGLSLSGKIGSENMIDAVAMDSRFYGRYGGMIQLIATNGVPHWVLADCVKSVKYEQAGACGSILIKAIGRTEEHSFVLEHRITVAPDRKDFLCEIVGVENTGSSQFTVRRFYLCPFAAEERPSVRKGVPNMWKGDRECYWKMSDGRLYGMVSSDRTAEWFNLWIDADGRQHPDIDFVPEAPVELARGVRHVPPLPMGARAVVSCQ